ncbi:unnamed protein product [Sphagnum balticum]
MTKGACRFSPVDYPDVHVWSAEKGRLEFDLCKSLIQVKPFTLTTPSCRCDTVVPLHGHRRVSVPRLAHDDL